MNYTFSEKTVKKYPVQQAIDAARSILNEKRVRAMCMNKVGSRNVSELLTLVEMNELTDAIVDDSIYFEIK